MPFRRIAGYAGLIAVVLLVVNTILAGQTPDPDASAVDVLDYYADYEWQAGLMLSMLIGPAIAIFSAGFFRAARDGGDAETSSWAIVGLIGLIATFAAVFGFSAVDYTLGARGASLGGETVTALWSMGVIGFTYQVASVGIVLLGFGMATLRAGIGPRWAGMVALVGAAAALVSGLGAASSLEDGSPLLMVGIVAFVAWLVWTAAVALTMLRTADA